MTNKEQVLKIYPDAVCFEDLQADECDHYIFCIMIGPLKNIPIHGSWYGKTYGTFQLTEQRAWTAAWEYIQYNTLKKLEE